MAEQRRGIPEGMEGFLIELDSRGLTRLTVSPRGRFVNTLRRRLMFEVPDIEFATTYRAEFGEGRPVSYKDVYQVLRMGRPDYVYAYGTNTPVSQEDLQSTGIAYFQDVSGWLAQLGERFHQAELYVDAEGLEPKAVSLLSLQGREPEREKLYRIDLQGRESANSDSLPQKVIPFRPR